MAKVTFDYAKANTFIGEHEVDSMKALAEEAKETSSVKRGSGQ